MAFSTVLATLHSITSIKKDELAEQREKCRKLKGELLQLVNQEPDQREKVRLLLEGSSSWSELQSSSKPRRSDGYRGRGGHGGRGRID